MDGGVGGVAPERPITRYETRRIHSNKFWAKHTLRKRHTNIQNREFIIMKQLKRKTDQTIKVKITSEIEYLSRFFITNRPTRVSFNTGCSIGPFVPSFVWWGLLFWLFLVQKIKINSISDIMTRHVMRVCWWGTYHMFHLSRGKWNLKSQFYISKTTLHVWFPKLAIFVKNVWDGNNLNKDENICF